MISNLNLYIVLPCYNEELNLEKVIKDFVQVYKDKKNIRLKFVLVNDGSKDNTLGVCKKIEKFYEDVHVIDHGINKGLGRAVYTGIKYVLDEAASEDLICILDSDNTHKAQYSLGLIDKVMTKKYDVVIASRFYKGSKVNGVPLHRMLLSYLALVYFTILLRIPHVKDYTCGYRVYTVKIMRDLENKYCEAMVAENGFSCMVELLIKLNKIGASIGESTFELYYGDKGGTSSMRILRTVHKSLMIPFSKR